MALDALLFSAPRSRVRWEFEWESIEFPWLGEHLTKATQTNGTRWKDLRQGSDWMRHRVEPTFDSRGKLHTPARGPTPSQAKPGGRVPHATLGRHKPWTGMLDRGNDTPLSPMTEPLCPLSFLDIHQPRSMSHSSLHEKASFSTLGALQEKKNCVLSHWPAGVLLHKYAETVSLSFWSMGGLVSFFRRNKLTH